ncbi:MAG: DUF4190 domain-containing protein [Renibacterium sp.]|nr:DUF4190 domain-containing protein [Renibacterium sp.]
MTFQEGRPATLPEDFAAQVKPGSGLAITALVLGVVALLLAALPFVSLIALLLGTAAVVLGIVALARRTAGKGMAITGIVTGSVGLLIAIVVSFMSVITLVLLGSTAGQAASNSDRRMVEETWVNIAPKRYAIRIVVASDIPVTVRYQAGEGAQSAEADGTWYQDFPDSVLALASVNVIPQDFSVVGSFSCEIFVDGVSVAKESGSNFVSCVSLPDLGK